MATVNDKWVWSGWFFIAGSITEENIDYMLLNDVNAYLVGSYLIFGSC